MIKLFLTQEECNTIRAGLYQLQHEATKRNNATTNIQASILVDKITLAQSQDINMK